MATWVLSKHRNFCVFDNKAPSISTLLRTFNEEHHLWCLAGARGMRALELGPEGYLG
ncbi:hypothetical protein PR202_ga10830 [Eleusine coracana subsp. coracana]|uniref:Uncharacterized protein n=1 Tax=Eleusine coracana subsp. coracana TaxID=191504 RepID=A0AAV5C7T9_ELECO|nr:hypothetical protein PR202_ga10830 [Eleusine coracana subsp. coracana]